MNSLENSNVSFVVYRSFQIERCESRVIVISEKLNPNHAIFSLSVVCSSQFLSYNILYE